MLGFGFAILSSLFYSLYVIPRKFSKLSPVVFSFFMAIAFAIGSVIIFLCQPLIGFHETVSPILWWAVFAGVMWAAAFVCFIISIDLIGLARSNQWKNLQGPVAVFLSFLFLQEFILVNPFYAIFAAAAIFFSALCFTIVEGTEKRLVVKGVFLALTSAVGFGAVGVIQKYVTDVSGVYLQQVVWSLSIVLGLGIYLVLRKMIGEVFRSSLRDRVLGLLAGLLYIGASFSQLFSYQHLAASVAFTLIQLSALWTILIGIIYFREIRFTKHWRRILFGFVLTIIGILALVFAKQ
ncbi:MAG TPA: hypothetical protein VLF20_05465 [Patescibacteria group bacterium]|nr:hypothetical protein [Patescibacteria group bacterium]